MRSTSASATSTWPASSRCVRPAQPLGRLRRGRAFAAHRDQRSRARRGTRSHQLCVGRRADQLRAGFLQAELQLLQRHRVARGEDDHADGRGWVAPKRWRSSASRKPERDAAVERAARGEGDQQPLGAVGIADGGARLGVDLADPLLERGDAAGDLGVDDDLLGFGGGFGGA